MARPLSQALRGLSLSPRLAVPAATACIRLNSTVSTPSNSGASPEKTAPRPRRLGHAQQLPSPLSPIEFAAAVRKTVPDDHPLYGFFYSKESSLPDPHEYTLHGRAWSVNELRRKSFSDLHTIWWLCIKEINIHNTFHRELKRVGGQTDRFMSRLRIVRSNMRKIRFTLWERYRAWEAAIELAEREGTPLPTEAEHMEAISAEHAAEQTAAQQAEQVSSQQNPQRVTPSSGST